MVIRRKSIKYYDIFCHLIGILTLLDVFAPPLFHFGSFIFYWNFIICAIMFVYFIMSDKSNEYVSCRYLLYTFFIWCSALSFVAIFRFPSSTVITGTLHQLRMMLLFVPYLWMITVISDDKRIRFYRAFRVYLFVIIVGFIIKGIAAGGIGSYSSLGTTSISKNTMGYSMICCALLFAAYEKHQFVLRPLPMYIWLPLCIIGAFTSKSGAAVAVILLVSAWLIFRQARMPLVFKLIIVLFFGVMAYLFINVDLLISIFQKLTIQKLVVHLNGFKESGGDYFGNTDRMVTQRSVLQQFDVNMAIGRIYYYFFAKKGFTAHQFYLELLYDVGIVGTGVFVVFCLNNIYKSRIRLSVAIIFLYSFIENFLVQYLSLLILALLVTYKPPEMLEEERLYRFEE